MRTDLVDARAHVAAFFEPAPSGGTVPTEHVYELTAREDGRYDVLFDGEVVHRTSSIPALADYVLWHVSWQVLNGVSHSLALHAGVVAAGGRAVLLPGPSGSGKTTLTAALAREGFDYLSDEAALLDPDTLLVHPYPRPLWVRGGSIEALGGLRERAPAWLADRQVVHVAPTDLGRIGGPSPIGAVIAPRYRRAHPAELLPMTRAEAVALLGENSFNFRLFGAEGVGILATALEGVPCFRLGFDDLEEAVSLVREVVGGAEKIRRTADAGGGGRAVR